jgi:serine/threonine-protein kinase
VLKQTVALNPALLPESALTRDERPAWLIGPSVEYSPLHALLAAAKPGNDAPGADYALQAEGSGHSILRALLNADRSATEPSPAQDSPERRDAHASDLPVRANAAARWPGFEAGPFRLTRRLGAGSLGAVWLAQRYDDLGPERVAIKFGHAAADGSERERLAGARQLMAALSHPSLARVYELAVDSGGQPYLVLQYIAGRSLLEYCSHAQPSVAQRVRLSLQAAQALAHAHAQSVVHGNLKPTNLLVTPQGTLRLLDLGCDRLLGPQRREAPASPYASPEQLSGAPADFASDVYALGTLLYEMLCGARPYQVAPGSTRALREAVLQQRPLAPSAQLAGRAELPAELDALVLRTLSKQPDERPSASGFARELKALLAGPLSERRPERRRS